MNQQRLMELIREESVLLYETGEPDQDYAHEDYDAICASLAKHGYTCQHREFDKYQGVYITVSDRAGKFVAKLWTEEVYSTGERSDSHITYKYKTVQLVDRNGEVWNATNVWGDGFNIPSSHVFRGGYLETITMDGVKNIIKNPRKIQVPQPSEVQPSTFSYTQGTVTDHYMLWPEGGAPNVYIHVSIKDGVADVSELVGYLEQVNTYKESTQPMSLKRLTTIIKEEIESDANLDAFIGAYIQTAIWSSTDDAGEDMDKNYGSEDLSDECKTKMRADCEQFVQANKHDIETGQAKGYYDAYQQAGHDFWLTRNHHGSGFWDGDWTKEAGKRLTASAQSFKEQDLYVGDDGKIYCE